MGLCKIFFCLYACVFEGILDILYHKVLICRFAHNVWVDMDRCRCDGLVGITKKHLVVLCFVWRCVSHTSCTQEIFDRIGLMCVSCNYLHRRYIEKSWMNCHIFVTEFGALSRKKRIGDIIMMYNCQRRILRDLLRDIFVEKTRKTFVYIVGLLQYM